jgi:hypothetical protein
MKYALGQLVTTTTDTATTSVDTIWMITKLDRDNVCYEIESQDDDCFFAMDHNLVELPLDRFISAIQNRELISEKFIKSFLKPTNIRTNAL